jgi:uracil-DNA glycosylase family 4
VKRNFVPDSGPLTARTLVVGEAPGAEENKARRPFVGRAGYRLNEFLKKAGIDRIRELRITNTYPYQPPNNVLALIPAEERARHLETLHATIRKMHNLQLIIPMGAYAMQALLPSMKATITQARGSVYRYHERKLLVLPMVHPMLTLYDDRWTRAAIHDWARARLLMHNPAAFQPLVREHELMPSLARLREYQREAQSAPKGSAMAVDIETPKKVSRKIVGYYKKGTPKWKKIVGQRFIACIAFSLDPLHSLTVPLTRAYWGRQLADAWDAVDEILRTPVAKVFHNGMFDTWHLRRVRIRVRNWKWDTKDMHHAIDAWDQHSLGYCASKDTWEPYWKDESKNEKGLPANEFLEQYWTYNGKDSCVTRELLPIYQQRLEAMS